VALSRKLCEIWDWKQPNGALRDMVCRGLLLMLERVGEIELPAVRRRPPGRLAKPKQWSQMIGRCAARCVS